MAKKFFFLILFFFFLLIGAYFRFTGNNWDQGQHLNPDERFLTMVATSMEWPKSFLGYLDTAHSKLNPHNNGQDFYVYGTWPIVIVKAVAERFGSGDYGHLPLIGRNLSAFADMITLLFVFLIGKRLATLRQSNNQTVKQSGLDAINRKIGMISGLISMACYSVMVLPIQLSHFYTTDPYLTLFLTVSVFLLLFPPTLIISLLLALSVAVAVSAKISGVLLLPIIALYGVIHFLPFLKAWITAYKSEKSVKKQAQHILINKFVLFTIFLLLFSILSFLSFRLLMPYFFAHSRLITFTLNPHVLDNLKALKSFDSPTAWFPPGVQWIHQTKLLFPLLNIIFIGLGLPLAMLCGIAFIWSLFQMKRNASLLLTTCYILLTFLYQGSQYAMPMRYFWPIYPILAAITGTFLYTVYNYYKNYNFYKRSKAFLFLFSIFFFLILLLWPFAFLSIYRQPHTRVSASEWMYAHIPAGSTISHEHWDDPLPLNLPNNPSSVYTGVELPMYYEDTPEKWRELTEKLSRLDYLVVSSNRVYGSITSAPDRYPQTAAFYQQLFSGQSNFAKVAEFSSRPTLPFPINLCIRIPFLNYGIIDSMASHTHNSCRGIQFIDDYAEESWTVYDHPKVTIFKRSEYE